MRAIIVLGLLLVGTGHAALLTPSEAEALGDRICKPVEQGLLDCQPVTPPQPVVRNERDPKPLLLSDFGSTTTAATVDVPMKPTLDVIAEKLAGNSVEIGWDIGYGTTAQYWEVWDNGVLRLRSQNFTQRSLVDAGVGDIKILAIQSGVASIDELPVGRHVLDIRLCNTASDRAQPACASVTAQTWVEGQGAGVADQAPDAPQIDWLPNVTTGEPIELAWHLWWGNPGRYWQVVDHGHVLLESAAFEVNDAHSQSGNVTLAGLAPGKHALSVKLCVALDCAQSAVSNLEVIIPTSQLTLPILAVQAVTAEGWVIGWSLPRYASNGKPSHWQWWNPQLGQILGKQQATVRECLVPDPVVPKTRVASWCGEGRIARVDLQRDLVVRVCQREDCIDSAAFLPDTAAKVTEQAGSVGGLRQQQ